MIEETIAAVESNVLAAEEEHQSLTKELDGFQRILRVIRMLDKVREAKASNFEETGPVEGLIEECCVKLKKILDSSDDEIQPDVDFDQWALTIESDARAQDPMMLSFDSGSDGDEDDRPEKSRSFRLKTAEGPGSSKGASTLLDILKSNGRVKSKTDVTRDELGKDNKLFWLSTGAWAFAVIGMMITIGFLTGDFLVAHRNVAIQIDRTEAKALELPALTICNDIPNIPTFTEYPSSEYPGLPLLGISTYIRTPRTPGAAFEAIEIKYPNTLSHESGSPVEEVVVTGNGNRFLSSAKGFDVRREQDALHSIRRSGSLQDLDRDGKNGLYCFRTGFKRRELLQPYDFNASSGVSLPAVQVKVFKLRLLNACRSSFLRNDEVILAVFVSELLSHAGKLEQRGILDFNGEEYDVLDTHSRLKVRTHHLIDFYCNVYFFSGYFYPSNDKANITYRFNRAFEGVWQQTGTGPYFTTYSWEQGAPNILGPDARALQNDTYSLDAVRLFAEETGSINGSRVVSPDRSISVLNSGYSAIYIFQRVSIGGKLQFRMKEALRIAPIQSGMAFSSYEVAIDFSTFETEQILTTPTMSWPEFLTDVFEFVGLFTGICIFTLIVAPAHSLV